MMSPEESEALKQRILGMWSAGKGLPLGASSLGAARGAESWRGPGDASRGGMLGGDEEGRGARPGSESHR